MFARIMPLFYADLMAQLACKLYAVPVLLGLGIAFYFIWPHEPGMVTPWVLCALWAAMTAWLWALHRDHTDITGLVLMTSALLCVTLGFAVAKTRAVMVATPMINASLGPTGVEGRVQSLEQLEGKQGYRLILDQLTIDGLPTNATPHAVRLSVRKGGEVLTIGQFIRVFAKIEPASNPTTPDGFDFRRHAYFQQIGGYGYVLGAPVIKSAPDTAATSIMGMFENMRNAITAHVNSTLDARQAGMVGALLTGERAAIAEDDWQALRDSGLAHLLAISGSNVDMVALIVFFVVRLGMAAFPTFAERYPIKKYAAVAAFLAALFYVLLILPSTPTLRALLTISIILLAILLDRSPISLRLVCASATLILLWQPEQLLSPSFQLSFAAVTALVAVFEVATPWLKRVHRDATVIRRGLIYVIGICGTTVIATLATAPISLYHFQTLALYGVVANAFAVPLMTFLIMPLSIICYLLLPFGIADSTLHVLGVLNDWVLVIAHQTADLPGARWTPPAMPFAAFVFIVAAGLMAALGIGRLKVLAFVPVCLAALTLVAFDRADMVVLQEGKVIMARQENGDIIATNRKYARRQQDDWVRYWGGDEDKGARVDKQNPPVVPTGLNVPITNAPVAIYLDDPAHVQVIGPRGSGRLWQ